MQQASEYRRRKDVFGNMVHGGIPTVAYRAVIMFPQMKMMSIETGYLYKFTNSHRMHN